MSTRDRLPPHLDTQTPSRADASGAPPSSVASDDDRSEQHSSSRRASSGSPEFATSPQGSETPADHALAEAVLLSQQLDKLTDQQDEEIVARYEAELAAHIPAWLRFRDKLYFTYAFFQCCTVGCLMLVRPWWLSVVYSLKCSAYGPARWLDYKGKNFHYFLFDFCYFATFVIVASQWLVDPAPFSALPPGGAVSTTNTTTTASTAAAGSASVPVAGGGHSWQRYVECCAWSYAVGPLLAAVPMWSNAFVLHSFDKMASIFLHLYPALVVFHRRFWAYATDGPHHTPAPFREGVDPSWWELYTVPYLVYLVWMVGYIVVVYGFKRERIQTDATLLYSVRYCAVEHAFGRKVCGLLGENLRVVMYFVTQAVYTLVTLLPTPFLYYHPLPTALLIALSTWSGAWNAAGYYMGYFARQYELGLKRRQREFEDVAHILDDPEQLKQLRGASGHIEGRILTRLLRRKKKKQPTTPMSAGGSVSRLSGGRKGEGTSAFGGATSKKSD
eukprot:TRINITY_DN56012_c0_g1_i1.p1 TRINITY_DN56012_c0_g1~~TRINITY_DN56012_c0_g1_i1.p1  ORF type:complete len:501 (-),score=113.93 TRINITY_DN56012_c0_g1_i1:267-1769(-)